MKVLQYVASLVLARFGQLTALILLSLVASPELFGVIAVASANTVILAQVCGSWIYGAALRSLSQKDDAIVRSTIALASWLACGVALIASAAWGAATQLDLRLTLAVGALAVGQIFQDVILAQLNARGFSGRYLLSTLVRGGLHVMLPVIAFRIDPTPAAVLFGFAVGSWGSAIVGVISARLHLVSLKQMSPTLLWDMFRFGVAAMFAAAFLVVAAGILRNTILHEFGPSLAGRMSLTLDIIAGLFAVVNSTVSLRFLPDMYRSCRDRTPALADILPYILASVWTCLTLAFALWMLPIQAIAQRLPEVAERWQEDLSRPLIVFVVGYVIAATALAVMMVEGRRKDVVSAVATAVCILTAYSVLVTALNGGAQSLVWGAAGLLVICGLLLLHRVTRSLTWRDAVVGPLRRVGYALVIALLAALVLSGLRIEKVLAFILFAGVQALLIWRFDLLGLLRHSSLRDDVILARKQSL